LEAYFSFGGMMLKLNGLIKDLEALKLILDMDIFLGIKNI